MTQWALAPDAPTPDLVAAVELALAKRAQTWRKPHTGVTPAQRFVVTFEDGSSAFVKAPVDAQTSDWSQHEHFVLSHLDADFMPRVLFSSSSLLITEDLSDAYWPADNPGADGPVRWEAGQVEQLLDTLERVAVAAPALAVPSLAEGKQPLWQQIATEPDRYASPDLLPRAWLEPLMEAERALDFTGDALVHNDVRSDNVCFIGDRAVLVDWTNARRGPAVFDRAEFALTYAIEGGPPPHVLVPDADLVPVWLASLQLYRVAEFRGQAPAWLVSVFERLAVIALDWAARCLRLA
jgi:hypothetical protein